MARDAVAVAMAQLGASAPGQAPNGNINAMDNLTAKVNEMRVNAVRVAAAAIPEADQAVALARARSMCQMPILISLNPTRGSISRSSGQGGDRRSSY